MLVCVNAVTQNALGTNPDELGAWAPSKSRWSAARAARCTTLLAGGPPWHKQPGMLVASHPRMRFLLLGVAALFTMAGCGGDTGKDAAGGSGGQAPSGGSGGAGGSGGSGGATGGAPATGLGGWGPAGTHGVTRIAVGYSAIGPILTPSSVYFGAKTEVGASHHSIYRLDKATGDAAVVAQFPDGASELAVSETRLFFAGKGFQGEGPPADGWLKIVDVDTGELVPFATFTQMAPHSLVVSGGHVWFTAGEVLRRIPTAGGVVEDMTALAERRPFAASGTRIYLEGAGAITAYDSATDMLEPLATWADPWSDLKLRQGSFYWRTMTASPALVGVPEGGGTPAQLLSSSGIHFDVGNHLFRDGGACPNGTVERQALADTTGEDWVTGVCWPSGLVLDTQHLYFFDVRPDERADLVRVDVE